MSAPGPLRLSRWWGALLLVLVAAGGAPAAEPSDHQAPSEEGVLRLPPVQVIAPAPLPEALPRSWMPGAVDILQRADIGPSRPAVLPDVLERLPGVTLQNEQGNPLQPTLTLRGFVASPVTGLPQGVSVFLDGVRINEPTVEEVNFDLIPLEAVDRIEVIRGPSVLFGRNTLGAAISLTTRRGEERREIASEISGGSFGHVATRFLWSGEARPLDYYLSLTASHEDGYRDSTESRVARAFGKIGVRAAGLDATVSYQYSNDRIKQAGSLPQSELRIDRRANFTAGDFFAPELNMAIVNARYLLGETLTLEGNGFVRALSAEQFNVNLIAVNTRLRNSTLSAGGSLQASARSAVAGRDNVAILGVEYVNSQVTSRTFEEAAGAAQTLEADVADNQNAVGVYAQDTLVVARGFIGPGSSLVLTAAARWDYLRHDIDDKLGGPSSGVFSYNRVNPRAGVNLNLSERLGFYASYSQGYRAPAFLELTCAGPGAVCPGLQVGVAPDPPLKAVTATNYEVGMQARPFPWLDIDVTAYRTDVSDDIFSVSPTGTTGVFFQNVGQTRREGVEVGLRGRWGAALDGYLNYAHTRATFQERVELATPLPPGLETVPAGSSLTLVPRHRVNAGFAYRPWPWLTLAMEARWVSSQFLRGDDANRQPPLPAYWVVNGGVTARWRGFEAFVRVNNALDNRYETFGTFAPNARTPGTPVERFLTPAPPANVLAGLRYVY
jgi:iron complex outermembrane recepter protein